MKSISLNPFRVLGIKANASAPEKQKARNKIAAYIKVGKPPILDFDLSPPLEELIRNQELIDLKSNKILSDGDKVKHALFWFVSGGTVDDIALSNLTEAKDIDKALANFEKGSHSFVINERSISSIINHSSLEIICYPQHKDRSRLKTAINRKLDIASSDRYLSLLLNFLNPNNAIITSREVKPEIIESSKELLKELFRSQKEEDLYLEFFSSQREIVAEIKEKNNQRRIRTIKEYVRDCENKREQILDNESGKSLLNKSARIGEVLLNQTEHLLKELSESSGTNSMLVSNIYEEVFTEVNYCGVGASNKFQELFGRIIEYDKAQVIQYVKSNGKSCYDSIYSLNQRAYSIVRYIDIPIRDNIKENLEIIKETRNDWRSLADRISQSSGRSGGTRPITPSNPSNESDNIWPIIVIVIGAVIGLAAGGIGGLIGGGIAGFFLVGVIASFTD